MGFVAARAGNAAGVSALVGRGDARVAARAGARRGRRVLPSCVTSIFEWQVVQELPGEVGALDVWQLVQMAWAEVPDAWLGGDRLASAPPSTNSCGLWQPTQSVRFAADRPMWGLWQVVHTWSAAAAGVCGWWQSAQPRDPACSAWAGARSLWQLAQSFGMMAGSPCGLWHVVHWVVECVLIAAECPSTSAWQAMHLGASTAGAKTWQVRQLVFVVSFPVWERAASFAWHRAQGATPGSLKPSRS